MTVRHRQHQRVSIAAPLRPEESLLNFLTQASEELDWQERALCAEVDGDLFFPEKGGSTAVSKRVCAACPVRSECLDYALQNEERFGIWGGLSERERRKLLKSNNGMEVAA
jgi:WhiB family redox-sensing transcriptional regulator